MIRKVNKFISEIVENATSSFPIIWNDVTYCYHNLHCSKIYDGDFFSKLGEEVESLKVN